jgi:transcriptional regulator with XRE-family HTH domain
MSGAAVKAARKRLGLTQQQAAARWKVSQPYLSLVENDKRRVPDHVAKQLARELPDLSTGLPLEVDVATQALPQVLGDLEYPGFAYLAATRKSRRNPATVLLAALRQEVPARVTVALPWLVRRFPEMNWDWLLDEVKRANLQNRLGYVVSLAREVAAERGELGVAERLRVVEERLEEARLAKEDTLGRSLTDSERQFLRKNRPTRATHWNVLTNLQTRDLRDA